jgi:hypothetical protein
MQDILSFFNQGWVGSLIGLIGIILGAIGIFSYKVSKSIARPAYQKSSLQLIGREEDNLPDEVDVTYKGKRVDRLTKTKLILWNDGTETLDGDSVVKADPITIIFSDNTRILSHKILKRTKAVNNFEVIKDDEKQNCLILQFDYLDPKDGIVLEILHDSEKRYPEITGTIKGLKKCFSDLGQIYEMKDFKSKGIIGIIVDNYRLIFWLGVAIGLSFATFGLLPEEVRQYFEKYLDSSQNVKSLSDYSAAYVIGGLLYAAMPASFLWSRRKKYPRSLEPLEAE